MRLRRARPPPFPKIIMWFKNLQLYRLPAPWNISAERLEEQLTCFTFQPAGKTEHLARGWIAPRGDGALVYALQRQWLVALGVEEKLLPASVVNQAAKERAARMEQTLGYKPGRKQMQEIKENVTEELLPRAFSRYRTTFAWVDPVNGWFVVDAANAKKAEEIIEVLRWSVDDFPAALLQTKLSPVAAMSEWLSSGEGPPGFSVDRDCELKSPLEEKSMVRYARHPLDTPEIRGHIAAGKLPTQLALTWRDRISFTLSERGEAKKLNFLDLLDKEPAAEAATDEDRFDADFALMTGELVRLLEELVEALGGEDLAQDGGRKAAA
jgi:recombination associated protein RdgC